MKNQTIVEKVFFRLLEIREVIKEDAQEDNLAAYIVKESNEATAVLYDADKMLVNPDAFMKKSPAFLASNVIKGLVRVSPTDQPCWGAWRVSFIAGPGKILYGLAYALSPNKILTSERERDKVSPSARQAWSKVYAKKERDIKPFDDAEDPKTPSKEDDCYLHDNPSKDSKNPLNNAYKAEGWEMGLVSKLRSKHKEVLKSIPEKDAGKFIEQLERGTEEFWKNNY